MSTGTQDPYRERAQVPAARVAPRVLPKGLGLRLHFGGTLTQTAWMITTIVLAMSAGFFSCTDLDGVFGRGQIEKHDGVVTGVEDAEMEENERRIMRVRFEVPGHEPPLTGASYTKELDVQRGDPVVVEVPVGRPARARIAGMRRKPFGPLLLLVIGPWILAMAAFVVIRHRRAVLDRRLLDHGRLAHGKLVRRDPTNVTINKKPVMKLSFDFEDEGGRHHRAVARSHKPAALEDDAEEPLLYDPAQPGRARLLDDMPGRPRLDADGGWIAGSPRAVTWTLLVLPVIAALELVLLVALVAAG